MHNKGGENIYPQEIENRLLEHRFVLEASVVGVKDHRFGEVVASFLRSVEATERPGNADIRSWVGKTLGKHKIPQYIFWIGDQEVGPDFPKTASGKHQKHILRALGNTLIEKDTPKSKL